MNLYRADNANLFLRLKEDKFFNAYPIADNKNLGKFYFYSDSMNEAKNYGQFISEWITGNLKILDLSNENDRKLIAPFVYEVFIDESVELHAQLAVLMENKTIDKKRIEAFKKRVKNFDKLVDDLVAQRVYRDIPHILNSQRSSDYDNGKILRKALKQLKYDGFCFTEGFQNERNEWGKLQGEPIEAKTYGLLKKPKLNIRFYNKLLPLAKTYKSVFPQMTFKKSEKKEQSIYENQSQRYLLSSNENESTWCIYSQKNTSKMIVVFNKKTKENIVENLWWKGERVF